MRAGMLGGAGDAGQAIRADGSTARQLDAGQAAGSRMSAHYTLSSQHTQSFFLHERRRMRTFSWQDGIRRRVVERMVLPTSEQCTGIHLCDVRVRGQVKARQTDYACTLYLMR